MITFQVEMWAFGKGALRRRFVILPSGFSEVTLAFQPPADDRGGIYAYEIRK